MATALERLLVPKSELVEAGVQNFGPVIVQVGALRGIVKQGRLCENGKLEWRGVLLR